MRGLEFGELYLDAVAGSDSKAAEIIGQPRILGRDEIGEADVRPAFALVDLLAEEMTGAERFGPRLVRIELHIVTDCIGRPEPDHRLGRAAISPR